MITKQIIENGLYGLAIGDALGVPYEFRNRELLAAAPCTDMVGGGTYNKPAGTWSDDTSMTLASMDGLINPWTGGTFDKIMRKFAAWLTYGEYTIDGVFGAGCTCRKAVGRYLGGTFPTGGTDEYDNGNGSLMRILPAVLFEMAVGATPAFLDGICALTHGHAISKISCRIYANVVKGILENNKQIKERLSAVIHKTETQGQRAFDRLRSATFFSLPECEIRSGGYVIDTLEAALWCFYNTGNFRDCVLKAVNLGSDTDTTAAVAGSLAGLYYGKENIPEPWLKTLRGKELLDKLIARFHYLAIENPFR
ncbi:hypothetical protein FACS1894211_16070 [Clostridia bacterium]|nr:hypothetical protein FACS1894211_16070 [Clostridia bacterium]